MNDLSESEGDELRKRIDALEERFSAQFVETEHRTVPVILNAYQAFKFWPKDDARRTAAIKALLYRFIGPTTVAAAGFGVGTVVAALSLLELRTQNAQMRHAQAIDAAFRARSRLADLAEQLMARKDCSTPAMCTADGGLECPFAHSLASRRDAANEYMWLSHKFREETSTEQVQMAHASLVWFEAQPDTPFKGASFYGTDFRCAVFRPKGSDLAPPSFEGTDFSASNLECAFFAPKSETAGAHWRGAICPDGFNAGETGTCLGHLIRPEECEARCHDPSFTGSQAFSCAGTGASGATNE